MIPNHKWIHRIPEILEAVEAAETTEFVRQNVQDIFGVGRDSAIALMGEMGGEISGVQWVIKKRDLLKALNRLLGGKRFSEITEHREKVQRTLEEVRPELHLRSVRIVGPEEGGPLRRSEIATLPDGVVLKPDGLEIKCSGSKDFLTKLAAFLFAMQNDLDQIQTLLDSGSTSPE